VHGRDTVPVTAVVTGRATPAASSRADAPPTTPRWTSAASRRSRCRWPTLTTSAGIRSGSRLPRTAHAHRPSRGAQDGSRHTMTPTHSASRRPDSASDSSAAGRGGRQPRGSCAGRIPLQERRTS
jgi:hypothetical protein